MKKTNSRSSQVTTIDQKFYAFKFENLKSVKGGEEIIVPDVVEV